jgi:acetyl-CoA carboxylase biotin carboxyl carrier protein
MDLTEEEVQRILRLVDELDYGEIHLEVGDLKIHLVKAAPDSKASQESGSKRTAPGTVVTREPPAASAVPPHDAKDSGPALGDERTDAAPLADAHVVTAPIAGIVYRAPGPGAKPFVQVGQHVESDDTLCLLEVMKLFHSVTAGIEGRVVQILAENGQPVVQGQPLFTLETGQAR